MSDGRLTPSLLEADLERMGARTVDLDGAGGAAAAAPPAPIRRYALLELLGEGGMGVVYKAYDARLDRKVALKVLRREQSAQARARFSREARALARLQHPNVVTVYDAGEVGERPYLAMALVDGSSLRAWLAETPRPWRAIAAAFAEAGKGLAAAHAQGLVHRDVKPENILVGRDGAVMVADFGVARLEEGDPETSPDAAPTADESLTREGVTPGTPRYMAPEQQSGRSDARSDQFSFCVALGEALEGADPPLFLRRIVERGTRADPRERWPGMRELVAELGRDPSRARRRIGLLAALLAGAAGVALLSFRLAAPAPACAGAAAELDGVWDGGVERRVRAAFTATSHPDAALLAEQTAAGLAGYARDWIAMRTESCRATLVRHTQSAPLFDRRSACLERRRVALAALTGLLAGPLDATAVSNAPASIESLAPLDPCADARALMAAVPPSHDPRVAALETRIAAASAIIALGRNAEAERAAFALAGAALAIDYPPTRARALFLAAQIRIDQLAAPDASLAVAEACARQALVAAAEAHLDEEEARGWLSLMWLLGRRGRGEAALALEVAAITAETRAGSSPTLRAVREETLGFVLAGLGRPAAALEHNRAAVEQAELAYGAGDERTTSFLLGLGNTLDDLDRGDEARAVYQRALVILERVRGPNHPDVAIAVGDLAGTDLRAQRLDAARAGYERALAIYTRIDGADSDRARAVRSSLAIVLAVDERYVEAIAEQRAVLAWKEGTDGPDSLEAGSSCIDLAVVEAQLGDFATARAHLERGAAIVATALPADHPIHGQVDVMLAYVELQEGKLVSAEERARRAVAIFEAALGPEHGVVGAALEVLGRVLVARGRAAEAVPLLERELGIEERSTGADSLATAGAHQQLGEALLGAGRPADALPHLERAVAIRAARGHDLRERGAAYLALARARAAGRDLAGARQAAAAALADYSAAGVYGRDGAAAAQAWLSAHGG